MNAVLNVALVIPLLLLVLPSCLYLGLLTLAAPFGAGRRARRAARLRSFVVLVPAHNEEAVLERLLSNLRALDYPPELVEVAVVADNCSDQTAAIARSYGVDVFERHDRTKLGKGYALQWLLQELQRRGRTADAYLVVDADSVLSPNYLTAMNARLDDGALLVQGYYTVLPIHRTAPEGLREGALALVHFLRPSAKAALGLSCGLKGNGMCFDASVIARFGWPVAGLAEDVEFHLLLVRAGLRVEFSPEAVVEGEMPGTLRAADSQNMRWEAGRLATLRRQAVPLLVDGIQQRNPTMLDAAIEQLLPPLSLPAVVAAATLLLSLAIGAWLVWPALVACFLLSLYVGTGLVLARVPSRVYRSLLLAPLYVGWKAALYARALVGPRNRPWLRTERMADR